MPRVIHFEIAADDPERAAGFYTKVFGWKVQKYGGPSDYWLAETGSDNEPGINGAIMRRPDPKTTTVNTVGVSSLEEYLDKVIKSGGKVTTEKMSIPGIGYFAYCHDTEGNPFGILQPDASAK